MTIVLDVSFDDNNQQRQSSSNNNDSQNSAISRDVSNKKKMKDRHRDNACSSKAALKVAKVKTKVSQSKVRN